jgi:hypothetical protein
MSLTMGTYADSEELAKRKRAAIDRMVSWIAEQRKEAKTATA